MLTQSVSPQTFAERPATQGLVGIEHDSGWGGDLETPVEMAMCVLIAAAALLVALAIGAIVAPSYGNHCSVAIPCALGTGCFHERPLKMRRDLAQPAPPVAWKAAATGRPSAGVAIPLGAEDLLMCE